jgi:NADH dehydrogenase
MASGATGQQRHRVVIVGGGFGGLFAAKFLRRADVEVRLLDRTNHHTFQPLLYQLATGILSEGAVAPPLREVLRKHRNVAVELLDVTAFDLQARTVTGARPAGSALTLPYDSLIVAAGATGSYFGHDEYSRFAPGMKTVDDALELRARIFGAFEMAELAEDPAEQRTWLTFAVIGAGPTGVEMAGQIAELSRRALKHNFRRIDPASAQVLLFDGGEEPLATFGDRLCAIATKEIERTGVELRMHSRVTDVKPDAIVVKGGNGEEELIHCHTKVWAAGVQASPLGKLLAEASGAETDRAGRVQVEPDCTLPGHREVFVVGDLMALGGLPGVAEVAMQSGIHAARTIKRRLHGDHTAKPFVYRDLGSMATISRFRAIVSFKGIKVGGFIGWMMWAFVHLTFLTGFKNRWIALFKWISSFVGSGRDERTITFQQVSARVIAMRAAVRPLAEDLSKLLDE